MIKCHFIIDKTSLNTAVQKGYIKGITMDFQNYDCNKNFDP